MDSVFCSPAEGLAGRRTTNMNREGTPPRGATRHATKSSDLRGEASRTPASVGRRPWRRQQVRRLLALILGSLVAFGLLEVGLRWYDPFTLRIKANRIVLPVNERTVIHNHEIEKIDAEIVHTRNALGLRGLDPPADFDRFLTIVAVGGSTTECYYLSDDKTWPEQMRLRLQRQFANVWVNNAGLDGHSTHGHQQLLVHYLGPLHPKLVLFLVGLNDVGNSEPNELDHELLATGTGLSHRMYQGLVECSATFSLWDNYRRCQQAKARGLVHGNVGHSQLVLSAERGPELAEASRLELLALHEQEFIPVYEQQLYNLIRLAKQLGIEPVLITQPALYGPTIDDVTKVDLSRIAVGQGNGGLLWQILDRYNDATRRAGRQTGTLVVDLARTMPKSSRYFYDHHHFTNAGADLVGQLIADALETHLAAAYPTYRKTAPAGRELGNPESALDAVRSE